MMPDLSLLDSEFATGAILRRGKTAQFFDVLGMCDQTIYVYVYM